MITTEPEAAVDRIRRHFGAVREVPDIEIMLLPNGHTVLTCKAAHGIGVRVLPHSGTSFTFMMDLGSDPHILSHPRAADEPDLYWLLSAGVIPIMKQDCMTSITDYIWQHLKGGRTEDIIETAAETANDIWPMHIPAKVTDISDYPIPEAMKFIHKRLRELAMSAVEMCDPAARKTALRFLPHARFDVYRILVRHNSERLRELSETAPGVLLFIVGLTRIGAGEEAERMIHDVERGRPLKPMLDDVLPAWLSRLMTYLRSNGRDQGFFYGGVMNRLMKLSPAEEKRLLLEKRLLILRMRHRVPINAVWLPPPIAFSPEDIPVTTRDNGTWYRVMYGSRLSVCGDENAPRASSFIAFISKNAVTLGRYASRGSGKKIGEMYDYTAAHGLAPGRKTSLMRLIRESNQWHRTALEVDRLRAELRSGNADDVAPDTVLMNPFRAWEHAGSTITPLTTAQRLFDETAAMKHCVARFVRDAVAGTRFFFSAVHGKSRLTIEVVNDNGRYTLGQVKGVRNREPKEKEEKMVRQWAAEQMKISA